MDFSSADGFAQDNHDTGQPNDRAAAPTAGEIVDLLVSVLSDGLDHPEIWAAIPELLDALPDLPGTITPG